MRKRAFEVVALVLALLPGARVMAQETDFYLPQIADGQGQGLTIRTTFVLFNPTARAAGFSLIITDDQGNPLAVTLPGLGTDSSFQFSLGAGETRLLETGGEGVLRTGAAVVTAESNVGVSAVFRIAGSGGAFITEAGVGASTPQTRFVLPVDTTGRFNTGVALFNFGGLGSDVTFQLYDTEGRPGLTSTANLPAGSHQARFAAGEGELFPTIGNFRGTMVVTSSRPVAAVVLRQNLDTFTSTTLPVVPANSQLHDFLLPQIANGPYAGGSIKTSFILFNVSNTNADVQVSLTKDDGTPFPVNIGGGAQSSFNRTLSPNGAVFVATDGGGTLSAGAAHVISSVPIGVSAIFTLYDLGGGFQTEAGVGAAPAVPQLTVPVDTTAGFDSGLALFNPSAFPLSTTVRLLDALGTRLDTATVPLPVFGHRAVMVGELFPGRRLRGSLSLSADGPVSGMTLRLNTTPLSYTTLPRTPAAFVGFAPRQALQRRVQSGVSVDSPVSLPTTLSAGFFLRGRITGSISSITSVVARSLDGPVYMGVFDSTRGEYRVAVPEGPYTLTVFYKPSTSPSGGIPTLSYSLPDRIVVNSDTPFDLTIPSVELRRVSGRMSNLGSLPLTAFLTFTKNDLTAQSQGFISMEGDYAVLVPQGDYSVSLSVSAIGSYGTNQLALYSLGTVTVGAGDATANFALPPLLTIQGQVVIQGASSIPSGSAVLARDISAPPVNPGDSILPPAVSRLPVSLQGGNFSGAFLGDRTYDLQAQVVVPGAGTLIFPTEPTRRNLTQNVGGVNFSIGALPASIEVTGSVTDPSGQPVEDVSVEARGESVAGLAGATFSAQATTNSRGEFRMLVLPGSNYTFTFIPEP